MYGLGRSISKYSDISSSLTEGAKGRKARGEWDERGRVSPHPHGDLRGDAGAELPADRASQAGAEAAHQSAGAALAVHEMLRLINY